MKIVNLLKTTTVVAGLMLTTAALTGCGGVSEAQMKELSDLRSEVRSLETEANSLKDERTRLERELAEKNAKLEQCERDKEETRVNLGKIQQ